MLLAAAVLTGCGGGGTGPAAAPANAPGKVAPASGLAAADANAEWVPQKTRVERFEAASSLQTLEQQLTVQALQGVSHLQLRGRGWGPELGRILAKSPALANVLSLDVSDNALGAQGASALASCPHLSSLVELNIGGNDIGDEGARALGAATATTSAQLACGLLPVHSTYRSWRLWI
jgi:hypothetical protein